MNRRTVDDALRDLEDIIDYARANHWRIGYFAALYRHVGLAFKHALENGVFDDAALMERLDVVFFDRFLAAVDAHRNGAMPTKSWQIAFETAERWQPTVLTHLLLGMNAHINLDLGIAVAETVPQSKLEAFKPDYDKMNHLLASLFGVIEEDLARIWPWLGWLDRFLGDLDEGILNFSMREARAHAWRAGEILAGLSVADREVKIEETDDAVHRLGGLISNPGILLSSIRFLMRLEQRGSVSQLIDVLLADATAARVKETHETIVAGWRSETHG